MTKIEPLGRLNTSTPTPPSGEPFAQMTVREPDAWNESARQYDAFEKRWHFYGTVADALIRELPLQADSRILELACGTGACTLKLARIARAGRVVALDFSRDMLAVARENAVAANVSNVSFVEGEVGDLASLAVGQRFHFAVCNSAFWHFPDPEKVLSAIHRVLTEEGQFALSVPRWVDPGDAARTAFRTRMDDVLRRHGVPPEEVARTMGQWPRPRPALPEMLVRCGFVVREAHFEFRVSRESRQAWRQISIFSDRERWGRTLPNLDPATQQMIRDEMREWRRTHFPRDPNASRWRILVAKRRTR